MDDKKDKINNSKSSGLELDSRKKDIDVFSFSKKDKNISFVFQKIKKLVAAIYLITNFFDDNEPLKWSFRKLGTEMIGSLGTHNHSGPHVFKERISETVALLEVASISGLVSSMNLDVLKKEFKDLIFRIEQDDFFGTRSSVPFSNEFFAVYEPQKEERAIPSIVQNVFNKSDVFNRAEENLLNTDTLVHKEELSLKKPEKAQNLKDFSPVVVKKNRRQSAIVALLRRKKEVMIKDVALVITDCSEKTIQRELLVLVEQGVLKKEGERRWTKYSLA